MPSLWASRWTLLPFNPFLLDPNPLCVCVLVLYCMCGCALAFLHVCVCVCRWEQNIYRVCVSVFLSFKANSRVNCTGYGWIWPPIALLFSSEAQSFSLLYLCPTDAEVWRGGGRGGCNKWTLLLQCTVNSSHGDWQGTVSTSFYPF